MKTSLNTVGIVAILAIALTLCLSIFMAASVEIARATPCEQTDPPAYELAPREER
jgi:hypothetical protein